MKYFLEELACTKAGTRITARSPKICKNDGRKRKDQILRKLRADPVLS